MLDNIIKNIELELIRLKRDVNNKNLNLFGYLQNIPQELNVLVGQLRILFEMEK
jgi:hypothetical protein